MYCVENVIDINMNLLPYGFVVLVLDNHTLNHTHTITKFSPKGSDYSNTCYVCMSSTHALGPDIVNRGLIAYMVLTTGTTGVPKKVSYY